MPLVYYVPEYERDAKQTPLDAERLLRLLRSLRKYSLLLLHNPFLRIFYKMAGPYPHADMALI